MNPFVYLLIQIAIAVASTLIAQNLRQNQSQQQARQPGLRGTTSMGTKPGTFIIGLAGTDGHRIYPRTTWGISARSPDEFLVDVIGISLLPVRDLDTFYVNGAAVTLAGLPTTLDGQNVGYSVTDFEDDGVEHMWVKFYDGTQSTADAYLLDKFGSHPERPWASSMVGDGISYAIITARANPEIFPTVPTYRFGIEGYSTVSTGKNNNPAAIIRTLLSGIEYDSQWFYGPQRVTSFHLPSTEWNAAENVCHQDENLKGGGTHKRYRAGLEVDVSVPVIDTVMEFAKSCNGRLAFVGGQYKMLVDDPTTTQVSITDADISQSFDKEFEQFSNVETVYNKIKATYQEPTEAWTYKEAREKTRAAYLAQDDGQEYVHTVRYDAVFDGRQAQRLMLATLNDSRRFRTHIFVTYPVFFAYQPLDQFEWTSDRNGYSAKKFMIVSRDDMPDGQQLIHAREINPNDYDWEPSTDEDDIEYTVVSTSRPPAQEVVGFLAFPSALKDSSGGNWRPAIGIEFDNGRNGIELIRVQIRRNGDTDILYDLEIPYNHLETPTPIQRIIGQVFRHQTDYDVRGKYVPRNRNRKTSWTDWQTITTGNYLVGSSDLYDGIIDYDKLSLEIQETFTSLNVSVNEIETYLDTDLGPQVAVLASDLAIVRTVDLPSLNAAVAARLTKTQADSLYAESSVLDGVSARVDDVTASGLFSMRARTGSQVANGFAVELAMMARLTDGGTQYEAGAYLGLRPNGTSAFIVSADLFAIAKTSDKKNPVFVFENDKFNTALIPKLKADQIDVNDLRINGNFVTGDITLSRIKTAGRTKRIVDSIIGGALNGVYIRDNTIAATAIVARTLTVDRLETDSVAQGFSGRKTGATTARGKIIGTAKGSIIKLAESASSARGAQMAVVSAQVEYMIAPNRGDTSDSMGRRLFFYLYERHGNARPPGRLIAETSVDFIRKLSSKRSQYERGVANLTAISRTGSKLENAKTVTWAVYMGDSRIAGYDAFGEWYIPKNGAKIDVFASHMVTKKRIKRIR